MYESMGPYWHPTVFEYEIFVCVSKTHRRNLLVGTITLSMLAD